MFANNHALIDRLLRVDEHHPTVLQVEQRIGHRLTLIIGDQRAITAALNITAIRGVFMEQTVQHACAAGFG